MATHKSGEALLQHAALQESCEQMGVYHVGWRARVGGHSWVG